MTGQPPPLGVSGGADLVQIRIDTKAVSLAFHLMPKVAYFWMRDFLFASLLQHRSRWLQTKSTKFGRGTGSSRGIFVSQINQRDGAMDPQEVRYSVNPKEKRASSSAAAAEALPLLKADIATENTILPIHEEGGAEKAKAGSRWGMFVAVKARPKSFQRWIAQRPNVELRFIPSKKNPADTLVYQVDRRNAQRGRPPKGQPKQTVEKLTLRWTLRKQVTMRKTLHLYDSWNELESARATLFDTYARKMIANVLNPDPRDL